MFTSVDNMIIVTPSKWLANLVEQSFLNKYPIKIINNGIDLNIFTPTESNWRVENKIENKFIILGVASIWEETKGFNHFIQLAKEISEDEIIVLVGVSEEQKKMLPGNIIGITRTNDIFELAKIYTAADVFVNPTMEDNFPTVNLEALACGTPVITFNTGGSVESINENCGMIANRHTDTLMKKIREIKEKNITPEECLKRANQFNKDERYNDYIKIYEQVKGGEIWRM